MPSTPPPGEPAPADGSLPPGTLDPDRPLSLYLHVPYCATRCGYCDFNTYTAADLGAAPGTSQDAYLQAMVLELDLAVRTLGERRPVQTVFFGGGTPTMLSAAALTGLLAAVQDRFELVPGAEVTTEANPETLDPAYLGALREAGFNRLSLGMQSAVPSVLAVLERHHTPGRVQQVVGWARAAGFESLSLDLIYGSPGEDLGQWRQSLEVALALAPDHLSAYSLIVEPGTRLAAQIARGRLPQPQDDFHADCYLLADELLAQAGLTAYEVSNWARPGHESRHNLAYWLSHDWWGFGPGAHSHVGGVRWWNRRHPRDFTAALSAGESPAQAREILTAAERRMEQVMLELRLAAGVPVAILTESEAARVPALAEAGLVTTQAGQLRPTQQGRLFADALARDLLD